MKDNLLLIYTVNTVKLRVYSAEVMVVNKTYINEQFDDDILQCKGDILRSSDTIPPYKEKPQQKSKPPKTSEDTVQTAEKEKAAGQDIEITKSEETSKKGPAEPKDSEREKTEIPRFDLAEKIMAEHRKVTAVKRKAPGKKHELQKEERQSKSVGGAVEQPEPVSLEQEQIIAEIVARDIEKLCRGETSEDLRHA